LWRKLSLAIDNSLKKPALQLGAKLEREEVIPRRNKTNKRDHDRTAGNTPVVGDDPAAVTAEAKRYIRDERRSDERGRNQLLREGDLLPRSSKWRDIRDELPLTQTAGLLERSDLLVVVPKKTEPRIMRSKHDVPRDR
jgi:hypothetical protein